MIEKILYRQCPKCGGDLSRTGDLTRLPTADARINVEVEYSCVQCGKMVYLPRAFSQEEYVRELKHYR